ncbi:MAG: S41 family peptidase [Bacteroidota bacterium]
MRKLNILLALILSSTALFAQNEPLWLRYPAISPDGQDIVFSYKGDLYKVSTSGGTAIPITLHEGHDYMPVWSHDGKHIAFASDRYGNFDVFVMPSSGGEAQRLTYHSTADYPSDFKQDDSQVIFTSLRTDIAKNAQFPYGALPELYQVNVKGGTPSMITTMTAEYAKVSADGSRIIYHDRKGYEDPWRKHHTSSITRDVWSLDVKANKYTKLTGWEGEDRNPVFAVNDVYYLSEMGGSFNVYKVNDSNPDQPQRISNFEKHPVRFLSASKSGKLCYGYDGSIYTQTPGNDPVKVNISVYADGRSKSSEIVPINKDVAEMALSPNGKEVAFIVRGEVFVSSVENGLTKRITNTPEQERSVSFSPDGRSLLYAGERNNNWNVYMTSLTREEEPYFYSSTVLKETPVVETTAEEFQPAFSPDGKEVAYLEERTTLKVVNLDSKSRRTILDGKYNYSYADGDQYYQWSPDGKWFLVQYIEHNWIPEAGLIKADGKGEVVNLTESGYGDSRPKWMMGGDMMIWFSDRDGQKNHGSWGGEQDVYAMFFTQEAYDKYKLSKADYDLWKEQQKEDKEKASDDDSKTLKIEMDGLKDRKTRLTIHSTALSDAVVSKDGEKLYYLSNIDRGFDIWMTDLRTRSTKVLTKLGANANSLVMDKKGKHLFVQAGGKIHKVDVNSGKKSTIGINGEMNLASAKERAYIFDHAWRQVSKKFYKTDLHGVDWTFYKKEYEKFLPHINNNHDFAEMLSEMLGELNASHTGCRYRPNQRNGDQTASLGLFYDQNFTGNGLKVTEVLTKGPLDKADSKVDEGTIIEKIDDVSITPDVNVFSLLNRKTNKNTLLSLYDPKSKKRWEEVVKPISMGQEGQLRYRRWVENSRKTVEALSEGRIGYVHVRGMNDGSYRTVVEEILGKNKDKEAIIVDTRFNGGGWLHEDLATFLDGTAYLEFAPRDQRLGSEPILKWSRPSAVLMSEGNYSDAHMFPYAYRAKQIGKLVGMPVPGTGTAVWWEQQIDPTLVFGIPQVGMLTPDGEYLENNQLHPDVLVQNDPEMLIKGIDQQLAKAVEVLLDETKVDLEVQKAKNKGQKNK